MLESGGILGKSAGGTIVDHGCRASLNSYVSFSSHIFFSFLLHSSYTGILTVGASAILCAAIVSGSALTGITEGLSLIRVLSFYPVVICWSLLTISSGLGAVRGWPKTARLDLSRCKNYFLSEKIFLGIILFIGAVSAVTAMVGVPNTWDAMTYHLPRVEHWIQNKTVAFYPTNDYPSIIYYTVG